MIINISNKLPELNSPLEILKFLDEKYDNLNGLKVSLFLYQEDIEFSLYLIELLNSCGCYTITIGSTTECESNRLLFELSDIVICDLNKHEINRTYYPKLNAQIIDLSGKSVNSDFYKFADKDQFFNLYTSV